MFKELDEQFVSIARQDCTADGATCLLGLVLNGQLTVANIGDSIATLVRTDGSWQQMNEEHTPKLQKERARIQRSQGVLLGDRINGMLSVSRAFGNYDVKNVVISEPDCVSVPLSADDDLLVLASDGLHRAYSQENLVRRISELRAQQVPCGRIAETIVEECLDPYSFTGSCNDNVTLVIVSLGDYLMDFERRSQVNNTPQQLLLRKQPSTGHVHYGSTSYRSRYVDLAEDCHSLLHLSESGLSTSRE